MNFGSHYECDCTSGYDGIGCLDVNECDANNGTTCNNHGTCVNIVGSFECTCDSGYSGMTCELDEPFGITTTSRDTNRDISTSDGATADVMTPGARSDEVSADADEQTFVIVGASIAASVLLLCGIAVVCAHVKRRRRAGGGIPPPVAQNSTVASLQTTAPANNDSMVSQNKSVDTIQAQTNSAVDTGKAQTKTAVDTGQAQFKQRSSSDFTDFSDNQL